MTTAYAAHARTMTTLAAAVVVGVDGSPVGQHAFRWAIGEAMFRKVPVRAVHVWSPPVPLSPIGSIVSPVDVTSSERAAKLDLEEALDRALKATHADPAAVEATIERGYAPKVLLEDGAGAGLLVVGTHGHGTLGEFVLGSVSQHCVRHTSVPLVVVPREAPLPPEGGDVVVGVDGSTGSQHALEWAMAEAALRGAPLVVVHAWWVEYPPSPSDFPFVSIDRRVFVRRSERMLRHMVDTAKEHAAALPPSIDVEAVASAPARALIERGRDAALLVVGTRGRGGFAGALLGSVSQHCVHHAPCAVAVIPVPREEDHR